MAVKFLEVMDQALKWRPEPAINNSQADNQVVRAASATSCVERAGPWFGQQDLTNRPAGSYWYGSELCSHVAPRKIASATDIHDLASNPH